VAASETLNGKLFHNAALDKKTSLNKISENSGDENTMNITTKMTCQILRKLKNVM